MSKMGAHVFEQQELEEAPTAVDAANPNDAIKLDAVEILDPAKPIAAYNPIKAAIAELTKQYGKTEFDVATTAGMDAAKKARAAIRDPRYKIEHIRKALKAPALAYGKRIDDEAEEYTAALLAIETPIDEQIKAREQQVERERVEKERLAAEARRKIDTAIADIHFNAVYAAGKTSAEIRAVVEEMGKRPLTEDEFGARLSEAVLAKNATVQKLCDMYDVAVTQEKETERLRLANEEAARVRQQQDAEAARLQQEREDLQRQQAALAQQQAATKPAVNVAQNANLGMAWDQEDQAVRTDKPAVSIAPSLKEFRPATVSVTRQETVIVADIDDSNPFPVKQTAPVVVVTPSAPRPSQIVAVIADHYEVTPLVAETWLRDAFGG